ncbi:heavy-metal-associated domain-containing protein [Olivibacter sp. SDN3]|uniref:heavy-metal-associated domain-containing protein n=1 Tax=Olivibacter sp. SDN3 TaxID=2764720 RepID=UPI001651874A|nr:heavy-metal-associated domain-containing protein [Olivibacter sp. SDN3]QNL48051.1 heavy-metal-associated domain-containing protein [Olivibacter sp. SDN3]
MESNHQKFQFKTNINCGGCLAAVEPHFKSAEGISHWDVDIDNKDKILTITSTGISQEKVIETVEKAGFKIQPLNA